MSDIIKINELENELSSLRRDFNDLKKTIELHNHLGIDGTKRFDGDTEFIGKKLILAAGNSVDTGTAVKINLPIDVVDNVRTTNSKQRRTASFGNFTYHKDQSDEQVNAIIIGGKNNNDINTPNDELNLSQIILQHQTNSTQTPPFSFLFAQRTPLDSNTEISITNGGNTLTDSLKSWDTNSLAGCYVLIYTTAGVFQEARPILSNTATQITISGTWGVATDDYNYFIFATVFLGAADFPYRRLYVASDSWVNSGSIDAENSRKAIRLGAGTSGGSQVIWGCYGSGSPEGVVTANIGSFYFRTDGGINTTFYIKESGNGTNTGWNSK